MNEKIRELAEQSGFFPVPDETEYDLEYRAENVRYEVFAHLIIQECIDKIETYKIPVGHSPSSELACEWTYDALKDIRDDIKATFGIKDE